MTISQLFQNQNIEIHATAVVYDRVVLNQQTTVGPFAVLGEGAPGRLDESRLMIVGPFSHIRSHTVIYYGTQIGAYFQTGHGVLVRENNEIGEEVTIGSGSVVENHVTFGNRVRVHSQVCIPEYTILEDDCWLGPNVVITNHKYPQLPEEAKKYQGVRIKPHAKIGANVTILPGVTIGRYAFVGAGSVVTKDVPDYAVVVGCPAVRIKDIRELPYEVKD